MPEETWRQASDMRAGAGGDDVRSRVLRTAIRHVEAVGLSLGVSDALIEQFAADSGVTPKQFSRTWPSVRAFLADLFCELADQARIDRADTQTLLTTWQYLSMRVDELRSDEGRRSLLIDIIRTAAQYNFDVVTASNHWRTYAALSTTIMAWPDDAERLRVIEALKASELAFVETMESFYRNVLPTIGYRLKPEFHGDYQPFVVAAASVIEGLGIVRATVPALVEARFEVPSESGTEAWTVASLAFVGVVDAFIEVDPAFDPDEAIARLSGGIDVTPSTETGAY